MKKLFEKLKEPSTVKGLIVIASMFGVQIEPEMADRIMVVAMTVYGIIQIFVDED
jgi:hypothetical protein